MKRMPPEAEDKASVKNDDYDNFSGPTPPMTVSEIDALRAKINQCYDVGFLTGSPEANEMYAELSVKMAKDGSIIGVPNIDTVGPGPSPQLAVLARKAIIVCAPYDMLPKDKYGSWRNVAFRFSVAGMQ